MDTVFDVSQFGIQAEDEFPHAFSEDHPDWNESYFFDWYDAAGSVAGHCRVGWHPVQQRLWFWLYLFNGHEWFAIEECRLPLSAVTLGQDCRAEAQAFSYAGWGLEFSYVPRQLLLEGELQVSGFARVLSGPRQGMIMPVALSLNISAIGAAYSRGAGKVESHSAVGFSTDRYEQPHRANGHMTIDGEVTQLEVRGERDHSWGPRPWDMSWQFFVINNERFSLLATQVAIPEWPLIQMGYYHTHGEQMEHLSESHFNLTLNSDDPLKTVSGDFSLSCDSGRIVKGTIETISGAEIDITHCFAEPHRSEYRRSLVRAKFDDGSQSIGWLECNRNGRSTQ
tara:strand:- start:30127 stop:31140 length:1014 start_codon:yes stop_codon:yes gene_type:complete